MKIKKLRQAHEIAFSFKGKLTKFGYACLKGCSLIESVLSTEDSLLKDKRNELASVDEKTKNLILTEKNEYTYTRENHQKLIDFIKEQDEREVEFTPYIAKDFSEIKNNLDIIDLLNGIIVDVDLEKYIEEQQAK